MAGNDALSFLTAGKKKPEGGLLSELLQPLTPRSSTLLVSETARANEANEKRYVAKLQYDLEKSQGKHPHPLPPDPVEERQKAAARTRRRIEAATEAGHLTEQIGALRQLQHRRKEFGFGNVAIPPTMFPGSPIVLGLKNANLPSHASYGEIEAGILRLADKRRKLIKEAQGAQPITPADYDAARQAIIKGVAYMAAAEGLRSLGRKEDAESWEGAGVGELRRYYHNAPRTALDTMLRATIENIPASLVSTAAAPVGVAGGGLLGAFGGPAAEVTVPVGATVGGIAAGMGAGMLTQQQIDKYLDKLLERAAPDVLQQRYLLRDEDQRERPGAVWGATFLTNLLTAHPVSLKDGKAVVQAGGALIRGGRAAVKALPPQTVTVAQGIARDFATDTLVQGGVNLGTQLWDQYKQTGTVDLSALDLKSLARDSLSNVIPLRQSRFGHKIAEPGNMFARGVEKHATRPLAQNIHLKVLERRQGKVDPRIKRQLEREQKVRNAEAWARYQTGTYSGGPNDIRYTPDGRAVRIQGTDENGNLLLQTEKGVDFSVPQKDASSYLGKLAKERPASKQSKQSEEPTGNEFVIPVRDVDELAELFQSPKARGGFGYDTETARQEAGAWDRVAQAWAGRTGRQAEDWYKTHLRGLQNGGQVVARRLVALAKAAGRSDVDSNPSAAVRSEEDGRFVVSALINPDETSARHELTHIVRRMIARESEKGARLLNDWVGANSSDWTYHQEERLVTALEGYQQSLRQPPPGLRGVFERIRMIFRDLHGQFVQGKTQAELGIFNKKVLRLLEEYGLETTPIRREQGTTGGNADVLPPVFSAQTQRVRTQGTDTAQRAGLRGPHAVWNDNRGDDQGGVGSRPGERGKGMGRAVSSIPATPGTSAPGSKHTGGIHGDGGRILRPAHPGAASGTLSRGEALSRAASGDRPRVVPEALVPTTGTGSPASAAHPLAASPEQTWAEIFGWSQSGINKPTNAATARTAPGKNPGPFSFVSETDVLFAPRKLTAEERPGVQEEAVEMYQKDGKTKNQVAKELNLHPATVLFLLDEKGVGGWTNAESKMLSSIKEAADMAGKKIPIEEITQKLNKGKSTIYDWLNAAGVEMLKREPTEDEQKVIVRLYDEEQLSAQEVAKRTGFSESTVKKYVKQAGLGRDQSEAAILRAQNDPDHPSIGLNSQWTSKKSGKTYNLQSAYELVRAAQLDEDPNVVEWSRNGDWIEWIHPAKGTSHKYNPDFIVTYADGSRIVEEVKEDELANENGTIHPSRVEKRDVVQAKAAAARKHYEDKGIKYDFVTETQLPNDRIVAARKAIHEKKLLKEDGTPRFQPGARSGAQTAGEQVPERNSTAAGGTRRMASTSPFVVGRQLHVPWMGPMRIVGRDEEDDRLILWSLDNQTERRMSEAALKALLRNVKGYSSKPQSVLELMYPFVSP